MQIIKASSNDYSITGLTKEQFEIIKDAVEEAGGIQEALANSLVELAVIPTNKLLKELIEYKDERKCTRQ